MDRKKSVCQNAGLDKNGRYSNKKEGKCTAARLRSGGGLITERKKQQQQQQNKRWYRSNWPAGKKKKKKKVQDLQNAAPEDRQLQHREEGRAENSSGEAVRDAERRRGGGTRQRQCDRGRRADCAVDVVAGRTGSFRD